MRIVAATNRDLRALVQDRRFREDLYYRLNVVTVDLPPLRARPEDLGPLADRFLRLYASACGKRIDGFSAPALALMRRYRWPGNVRELENAVPVRSKSVRCYCTLVFARTGSDLETARRVGLDRRTVKDRADAVPGQLLSEHCARRCIRK